MGFSGSIGLWLSYHKLPIWECLQNGVPQTFFFHLEKSLGHSCGHPYFETSPYVFHRSPTYVKTPRINWASPGNTQGFFKPFIGSPMFTQGPIGLWLSYHKLPICLPQVTHICQTTQGKLGITRETQKFFKPCIRSPMFIQWAHWSLAKVPIF